ncbi:MAG: methylmalonyl-CoA mutase family protein [Thermoanaerobaculaceae bacterium]|nr:methylmalonyl-CoA mutase family protein [Thermoanaerobaculaceae bacterium]
MSRIPNFATVPLQQGGAGRSLADWAARARAECGVDPDDLTWVTNEQIPVRPLYAPEDLRELEHLGFTAGLPPFLRGPYASMYVIRPWTVRQYAGFSTATSPPTAATTRTTRGWSATWARRAWPSTPWRT